MGHKFKDLLIREFTTIKSAMKKIQVTSKRVLFVVDNSDRLLGVINDGDMRRWILDRGDLNRTVKDAYNKSPIYVKEGYKAEQAAKMMAKRWLEIMPVVSMDGRITDIIYRSDISGRKHVKRVKKIKVPLVIMAGGKGKRLDPFTRILPKALVPIGDQPVIEMIMDRYLEYGCDEFYLVLNHKAGMIKAYFDGTKYSKKIKYIFEDKQYGTCGGLRLLPKKINEDIFVSNCDMLIKADYGDIYNFHRKHENDITIVGSMRHFKIPYGVLELKEEGALGKIVEKPEYDHLVNTGMYVIKKKVMKFIPDTDESFHFTHLIKKVIQKGGKVKVYPISEKSWLDAGQWNEYWKNLKNFGK